MSIRLLLESRISQGRFVINDKSQLHHLLVVMKIAHRATTTLSSRRKPGSSTLEEQQHSIAKSYNNLDPGFRRDDALVKDRAILRVFNELDGEWEATVINVCPKKSFLEIEVHSQLRLPEAKSGIKIAFSLIKPDRLKFLVEKTTEIGVDGFIPVISDRCVMRDVNTAKMRAYITGAVEQSERITIPKIMPVCKLKDLPLTFSHEQIVFCNEAERDRSIVDIALKYKNQDKIILIGPEGGFTTQERNLLMACPNVHSVFLTKNILRSETAAIFAMSKC